MNNINIYRTETTVVVHEVWDREKGDWVNDIRVTTTHTRPPQDEPKHWHASYSGPQDGPIL